MKPIALTFLLTFSLIAISVGQTLSPYYQLGTVNDNISNVGIQIEGKVAEAGFKVLGSYAPGNQTDLMVVVFTNDATRQTCQEASKQGLVAANYRIGLEKTEQGVLITTVNPEYQWRAYLTEDYASKASKFSNLLGEYESFCKKIGNGQLVPFGGEKKADDLEDYHYMFGMPYYEDQVTIKEFDSYESAITTINSKINKTNGIKMIYSQIDESNQMAVYGVGLVDSEIGESHFLSIIGQKHVAAMPYELIVDGSEVRILHGRFRFALYWPELTMGTFTKIMSTPGDVESMMSSIVK